MKARELILIGLGIPALLACEPESGDEMAIESNASAVIYGEKDLMDAYAHPDEALRDIAESSVATMTTIDYAGAIGNNPFDSAWFEYSSSGRLGEQKKLCDQQEFFYDFTRGECSATLIDDDLIITAGHCLHRSYHGGTMRCEHQQWVFNYRNVIASTETNEPVAPIYNDDVYGCAEIVVEHYDSNETLDYAVVRLDRSATENNRHTPVPVKPRDFRLDADDAIAVVGFPNGTPAKISEGDVVAPTLDGDDRFFTINADMAGGSSGSGIIDTTDYALAGVLFQGPIGQEPEFMGKSGYRLDPINGCYVDWICSETEGCTDSNRDDSPRFIGAIHSSEVLDVLCADRPANSHRLCAEYAKRGDVNGDGEITVIDALMIAQYYVGLNPPGFFLNAADVNGDGQVNIVDALVVARVYVGLEELPELP